MKSKLIWALILISVVMDALIEVTCSLIMHLGVWHWCTNILCWPSSWHNMGLAAVDRNTILAICTILRKLHSIQSVSCLKGNHLTSLDHHTISHARQFSTFFNTAYWHIVWRYTLRSCYRHYLQHTCCTEKRQNHSNIIQPISIVTLKKNDHFISALDLSVFDSSVPQLSDA